MCPYGRIFGGSSMYMGRTTLALLFLTLLCSWRMVDGNSAPPPGGCPFGQGVNALPDGDFGSGIPNILPADPGIAPGYTYTTNPPPEDGFYTITNNTGPWGSFATNWIDIGDNSMDPNGYMMVINASFAPGIFYSQQVDVCSGSEYQFSADIINLLEPSGSQEILPNVDFLINGQVLFSTGDIPQNGQWQNVGFVFPIPVGLNMVQIEIRNNAPGGQGNDLALDNIEFFTCGPLLNVVAPNIICTTQFDSIRASTSGGSYLNPVYQWQESSDGFIWFNIPGANNLLLNMPLQANLFYRIIAADGNANLSSPNCRVISDATFVQSSAVEIFDTTVLCVGDTILIADSTIIIGGHYDIQLVSTSGCDSLLHLLVIGFQVETFDTISLCNGDFIEIGDVTIDMPGSYDIPLQSSSGCDSVLHLEVNSALSNVLTLFDTICIGELYQGQAFQNSTLITDSLFNTSSCDSIIHINLYVDNPDLILPMDVTINRGESYTIIPALSGSIVMYSWTPDTAITCLDCPIVDVNPIITTQYTLEVTTEFGCVVSDSINISVFAINNIYIPSAFSPNNDGINDGFFPFTNENIRTIEQLSIYDRWGAKVYEINNISPNQIQFSWDGTNNNKSVNNGVYVYHSSFVTTDGNVIERTGEVLVVR